MMEAFGCGMRRPMLEKVKTKARIQVGHCKEISASVKDKAVRYGVYGPARNEARVSVGISSDTTEFAADATRAFQWRRSEAPPALINWCSMVTPWARAKSAMRPGRLFRAVKLLPMNSIFDDLDFSDFATISTFP
jgi:hypothetical protein